MKEQLAKKDDISAREVITYLRNHPEFFQRHEHLLEELLIPHESGAAVSLVERQVTVLREQKQDLQRQMQHIMQTARGNEQLLERMQALLLRVMASADLAAALEMIYSALREDFHADVVAIRLIDGPAERAESVATDDSGLALFRRLTEEHKPVCGYINPEQRAYLFGEQAHEVASGVLIPLCEPGSEGCLGLLAIGSVDPRRYHADMGTVFISHLGVLLAHVLRERIGGA